MEEFMGCLVGHFMQEHFPHGIPGVVEDKMAAEGDLAAVEVPVGQGAPGIVEGKQRGEQAEDPRVSVAIAGRGPLQVKAVEQFALEVSRGLLGM